MLSNLAETLYRSAKLKNKQVAKKQRFGTTIRFPEGLKDSPLKKLTLKVIFLFQKAVPSVLMGFYFMNI